MQDISEAVSSTANPNPNPNAATPIHLHLRYPNCVMNMADNAPELSAELGRIEKSAVPSLPTTVAPEHK